MDYVKEVDVVIGTSSIGLWTSVMKPPVLTLKIKMYTGFSAPSERLFEGSK